MAIGLTLTLAACGGGSPTSAAGSSASQAQIPGLAKPGTLTLATTGNFPPFTFIGTDGKVQGYSIDIGQELAHRLGLQFESPTIDFVAELQGLNAGKYDLADSGIWPTAERQKQLLFTVPVASTGFVATTLKQNLNKVKGLDNLAGLRVGAVQGSTRETWLLQNKDQLGYASYQAYPGVSQALLDLKNGRIDVIVDDPLVVENYIKEHPDEGVTTAGAITQEHPLSFALNQKSGDLQAAVNGKLKEMIDDGTLLKLQKKYWGHALPMPGDINAQPPYPTAK